MAWSSPSPWAVRMGSPLARSCCQKIGGGFHHSLEGAWGEGWHGVSIPKGISIPSRGSEQASAQKLAEPCTFGSFPGRIRPLREVGRAEAAPCQHRLGPARSQGFGGRVQASLPHWQQCGFLDEAFSVSIILPALEMPKPPGNLCPAQFGCGVWFPGDARRDVLQMAVGRKPGEKARCDLSRLANLRSNVPSPVPSSASMGWCLGGAQPAAPGCPGDTQPAQTAAQRGKDGHRVTWLVFSRKKRDDATTTGGPAGLSSVGCVWGGHRSPFLPWYAFVLLGHCVTTTHWRVPPNLPPSRCSPGPGRCRVTPAAHPCLSPGLGMLQKTHPGTCFGLSQGWAQPGSAQPCSFSPFTLSQGFSQLGRASHDLKDRFFRGNAAFLHKAPLSPRQTEWAGASSSPFAGDLGWAVNTNRTPLVPSPAPTKPPCIPRLPRAMGPAAGTRQGCSRTLTSSLQKPCPRNLGTPKTCFFFLFFFLFYFCSNKTKILDRLVA